ncbi:MAG: helix-turn-helix domain-containing protein [Gemmatimonadota bacterium]|nr:helix-turn-helix domain-containing protein [Gemmatimonadota bacterium]
MLTQRDLGQRLKSARETIGLTQQRVADEVALTCVAISQIESGHRAVSSLELMRLSRLYGQDMASFLEETPVEKDALAVLIRAYPDLIENENLGDSLRDATELFRAYTNLKELLGLDQEGVYLESKNIWESIQMDEQAAGTERGRLDLGIDPILDLAQLARHLNIEENREHPFNNFVLNFMGMAIEAYRRDEITYRKLVNLAEQVKFDSEVIDQVLSRLGVEDDIEHGVYLPD